MADDSGVWVKIVPDDFGGGGLEGLGDWAEITAMTGDPKRYTGIMVDGVEFWAFEWAADGELTTSDGLVQALVVSRGHKGGVGGQGGAGQAHERLVKVVGKSTIVVQSVDDAATWIQDSSGVTVFGAGRASLDPFGTQGFVNGQPDSYGLVSDITGVEVEYACSKGRGTAQSKGKGIFNFTYDPGVRDGVVIVRVPAAKVTATGGWV